MKHKIKSLLDRIMKGLEIYGHARARRVLARHNMYYSDNSLLNDRKNIH